MKQCPHCKGKHEETSCLFWLKAKAQTKIKSLALTDSLNGSAPAPFLGHYGYPNISVGILSLPEYSNSPWIYDAPKKWAEQSYNIEQIVDLRTSLLNSRIILNVKNNTKFLDLIQEVAMAKNNSAEVEIKLEKPPKLTNHLDPYSAPHGPKALLKKAELTNNPNISAKIEKVVYDTDLKAQEAINYLYKKNIEESALSRLLSVGILGIKKNRKLVPTRWAITAVDDQLGKQVISQIKENSLTEYQAFFGSYLGNYYLILLIPDMWSYELFEIFVPTNSVATDYEGVNGRTNYSEACTGGYYTVRLATAEKLKEIKKQASILVFRFITEEYTLPLGVWVTREATRKTMNQKPITFSSKELMIAYATALAKKKFSYDLSILLKKSWLLKNIQTQKRLVDF
ncbi:hypothetical protein HYV79_01890 [Candidatus Woesearchaeota archaeon]|nr:hypothetical protein [Candidatus Woesearchaeota archaeon]